MKLNLRFALFPVLLLLGTTAVHATQRILSPQVKSLTVRVNDDWVTTPVMTLGSQDVLNISFDELSHHFHRYIYTLERCEADWEPATDVFESDWLEGFNNRPIDDYESSVNTVVNYTHYRLQIPNADCRLKMSGNYRLHVYDDDNDGQEVLTAEFMVKEDVMNLGLELTTNTDLGMNTQFQQLSMTLGYGGIQVTRPDEQLWTVVWQNGREATRRTNVKPDFITSGGLKWSHNRALVFEGGNEYRKYEILDVSHPTLGLERILWDGSSYNAYPFVDEPRRHYLYDEDANGAFYIRNSDNYENDRTCEYVYVHYKLCPAVRCDADVLVGGQWATGDESLYTMTYDETDHSYHATVLQKQGYYNYQYLVRQPDGTLKPLAEEGSFHQTENRYEAFVYYKGDGQRTWRLLGYRQLTSRQR